jgi:hypothetical protein
VEAFSNCFARESVCETVSTGGINLSMWRQDSRNVLRSIAKTIDLDNAKYREEIYKKAKVCKQESGGVRAILPNSECKCLQQAAESISLDKM